MLSGTNAIANDKENNVMREENAEIIIRKNSDSPRHGVVCRIKPPSRNRSRRDRSVFYVEGDTGAADGAIDFLRGALGLKEGNARKFRLDEAHTSFGAVLCAWSEIEPYMKEIGAEGEWKLFEFGPEVFADYEREIAESNAKLKEMMGGAGPQKSSFGIPM